MTELNETDQAIFNLLVDPDQLSEIKYPFDDDFLRVLLGVLLSNRFFHCQCVGLIKPTYFRNEIHQAICRILFQYFEKYKQLPSKIFMKQLVDEHLKNKHKNDDKYRAIKIVYFTELNLIYDYYTKGGVGNLMPMSDSPDAILDKITSFARTQAMKFAWAKSVDLIKSNPEAEETWNKIDELYKEARLVNRNIDLGLDYFESPEDRYARLAANVDNLETFTLGFRSLDKCLVGGGLTRGELGAVMALAGTGKTWIEGTEVLMYDGTIKAVENVKIGDLVMGDDSTPRRVINTHSLWDEVYEIRPTKGKSYYVNAKHVLSLKNSHRQGNVRENRLTKRNKNPAFEHHFARMGNTNIYNISVEDWFKQSNHFKKEMKGWRVGVEWPKKEIKINPYILGLWLGDGTSKLPELTNVDSEVVNEWFNDGLNRNLHIRKVANCKYRMESSQKPKYKNSFYYDLQSYNLVNNKHIPFAYKINSRDNRLQLLAGLIDSDGYKCNDCGYEFVNKNKTLAKDVLFLARSLGFAAYMRRTKKKCQTGNGGYYWRISISGDCSQIPVCVQRKKCTSRQQVKSVLMTGINVIPKNIIAKFFGFETDGNHLFLLADFTVVHNSIWLAWVSVKNVLKNKKVLYISTEMDQDRIASRFDSMFSMVGQHELMLKKEEVWQALRDVVRDTEDKRRLIIKQFPSGTADLATVRAYYSQLEMLGFKPDLVIYDYPGDFKDYAGLDLWHSRYRMLREIRGFAIEEQHCALVAIHPNRVSKDLTLEEFMDEGHTGDSFKQNQVFDFFLTFNQTSVENRANIARAFVAKARNGKSRFPFWIRFHFKDQTLRLEEISRQTYTVEYTKINQATVDDMETNIDTVDDKIPHFQPSDGEQV